MGFLKSRVYAKLLTDLISERYQTFIRYSPGACQAAHNRAAYKVGNKVNKYAIIRGCT
jgi:hypothetical protein